MVEAMYEQSPEYFKQFRKNYKFFNLNYEPNFSGFASKANFAVSSHSNKLDFCNHSIDNKKHYQVLVEFTKESTDLLNKMTSKAFVVLCLLSTFKYLSLGCSNSIKTPDVSVFQFADDCLKFASARRLNLFKLKLT